MHFHQVVGAENYTSWEVIVEGHFTASLWLQHCRMSKPTFETLCNSIDPFVGPKPSPGRRPIPTEIRIAIELYKLATCAEYGVVGETFWRHLIVFNKLIPTCAVDYGCQRCDNWPLAKNIINFCDKKEFGFSTGTASGHLSFLAHVSSS